MIALLQRVKYANVIVNDYTVGSIDNGLLVFLGIEKTDGDKQIDRMLNRIFNYRIFSDSEGRMNLNVQSVDGGVLLVPQFTLVADTKKGMRPGFSSAASPEISKSLFEQFVIEAKNRYAVVETGEFGSEMQVNLCNDGPATFILKS